MKLPLDAFDCDEKLFPPILSASSPISFNEISSKSLIQNKLVLTRKFGHKRNAPNSMSCISFTGAVSKRDLCNPPDNAFVLINLGDHMHPCDQTEIIPSVSSEF